MDNKKKAGIAVAAASAAIVLGTVILAGNGDAEPTDVQFYVEADTREIVSLVPASWKIDQDGKLVSHAGHAMATTDGSVLEPCTADQRKSYAEMGAATEDAAMDYEDAIQAKIRQLAVDALHAEGIDPPSEAKKLYLDKGKITDKKPTAVAID